MRRSLSVVLVPGLVLACVCAGASRAAAQTPQETEAARLKGIDYLKSAQLADGSWEFEGHQSGITALCGLALIENGISVSDPLISRAQSYVRKQAEDLTNTYDLALTILFLSRIGDRDDRNIIRESAARLIAGQNEEGGWSYTCPKASVLLLSDPAARPAPQKGPGDNSCTQFAVLGLWVSSRWGVNIDLTLDQVALRFIDTQLKDGSWAYNFWDENSKAAESMTFAGLFCLTVAKAARIREQQTGRPTRRPAIADNKKPGGKAITARPEKPAPAIVPQRAGLDPALVGGPVRKPAAPGAEAPADDEESEVRAREPRTEARAEFEKATTLKDDAVFAKGLERASQFAAGINPGSAKYFLWSVERLGVILGIEHFGQTDWFSQGAQSLLAAQQPDGSWNGAWGNKCDTAFAILFLRRANLGSDISRLLEGEPEQRFVISSRPDRPRFDSLEEAIREAQAGETVRIDGDGPFDLPHLDFAQDLTLQAGAGYSPVLRYEIGSDANGARSRPESDPAARHLIRVNAGNLLLEGLELRVDNPKIAGVADWSGIVMNGGNLRMLNCSISEDRKNQMAAVRIVKPGRTVLRNCLLVGGSAAVEIETTGEQSVTIDNTVLFSDKGISIRPGADSESSKLQLVLRRSTVQATDAFAIAKDAGTVDLFSLGVAYKASWLGSHMLSSPNDHPRLNWTGSNNNYDLVRWIGADGTAIAKVKDPKTFNEFWGGRDEKGQNKPLPFNGKKTNGAFSHSVRGEDFDLPVNSPIYAYRLVTGVEPLVVGPGSGFVRFRESFDYRDWATGADAPVAAN